MPGLTPSFVDHEVAAATAAQKAVTFLISENGGSLPNTADKRYPIFKLELTVAADFLPLVQFLHYVGSDFRSAITQVRSSLKNPWVLVRPPLPSSVALSIVLLALLGLAHATAQGSIAALLTGDPSLTQHAKNVLATQLAFFGLVAALVLVACSYMSGTLILMHTQWRAQRKALLRIDQGEFKATDWVKVTPPGGTAESILSCLFEEKLVAHHERG